MQYRHARRTPVDVQPEGASYGANNRSPDEGANYGATNMSPFTCRLSSLSSYFHCSQCDSGRPSAQGRRGSAARRAALRRFIGAPQQSVAVPWRLQQLQQKGLRSPQQRHTPCGIGSYLTFVSTCTCSRQTPAPHFATWARLSGSSTLSSSSSSQTY